MNPKVSLPSQDTEKVLAELNKEEVQAKEQAKTTVQNFKTSFSEIEKKLEKLLDVYLDETITAEEYASRKEKLVKQKVGLREQIHDFEQKGLSWLVSLTQRLEKNDKLNTGEPAHSVSESFDVRRSSIWYFPGI